MKDEKNAPRMLICPETNPLTGCWIFIRILLGSEWLLQLINPVLLFAVCLHNCGHLAQATNWANSKIRLVLAHTIELFNQDV